jgi:hypothetical protein
LFWTGERDWPLAQTTISQHARRVFRTGILQYATAQEATKRTFTLRCNSIRIVMMSSPSSEPPEIWIGKLEIRPFFDSALLGDATGAFVNVLTWASNPDQFRRKCGELMDSLHMQLIAIENAEPLASRGSEAGYETEFASLVREVRLNPNAIRYSTFHTWSELRCGIQ